MTSKHLFQKPILRQSLGALSCIAALTAPLAFAGEAHAGGTDCVVYATDYANAHMGSGDVVGDAVSGGMAGAVAGGEWQGASGAARGARAGGALGVLDNLGSMPGGWDALYEMAYQMCLQQDSGASDGLDGTIGTGCHSSASVDAPMQRAPDGSIIASSGGNNCR